MPPTTRRGNMFGPYMLLQTLGEGEFAKVKLGMHAESGEEVSSLFTTYAICSSQFDCKLGRLLFFEQIKASFPYHTTLNDPQSHKHLHCTCSTTTQVRQLHTHTHTHTHKRVPNDQHGNKDGRLGRKERGERRAQISLKLDGNSSFTH